MKTSLVLQGPIYPFTSEIIDHYLTLSFIDEVIISCWDTDIAYNLNSKVKSVISNTSSVLNPGGGNINYQLQTSLLGVKEATGEIVIKIRTDQQYHLQDMWMMHTHFLNHFRSSLTQLDGTTPEGKVFTAGIFAGLPYHPKDHLFWGFKKDLVTLFDIPHSTQPNFYPDIKKNVRAETYLGAHYFSKFNLESMEHVKYPEDYLMDNSVNRPEAMRVYSILRDSVFGVFPRVKLVWKKNNVFNYTYLGPPEYGEYWG